MQTSILIVYTGDAGRRIADTLQPYYPGARIIAVGDFTPEVMTAHSALIFIGAMGICVRKIVPLVDDKHTDPAVVCVDTCGLYAIPVLSGHIGGANRLATDISRILGAQAVVTTRSDNAGLWPLDTLASRFGWAVSSSEEQMQQVIFLLCQGRPIALLDEAADEGAAYMRRTMPANVSLIDDAEHLADRPFEAVIVISPRIHDFGIPSVCYIPRVLCLGIGCHSDAQAGDAYGTICATLLSRQLSPLAVGTIATLDSKRDTPLVQSLATEFNASIETFDAERLDRVSVPNPSEAPAAHVGTHSVCEAAALLAAGTSPALTVEKQKVRRPAQGDFTFAVALPARTGHIEIVGAGPGDPDLISVRGRQFLERADLILYAGSLVPRQVVGCAKAGALVVSSAGMNLEQQFSLMRDYYDRGMLIVRLHTGDPCLYGAIQEQMALFDSHGMSYHITPGISAFQAAAAELRSQFTIPDKTQTVILTRDEGRTPVPERERLSSLARSQSTMCIYLSADLVESVQQQLLTCYPPDTPVAVCHKLTWPEQAIYRGRLYNLASLVRDNHLSLTTLLVVGEAIDNRRGLSRLYDSGFSHLFRHNK